MNKLIRKELRLSASLLSYLFIAFGLMTLLPRYPILVGAFFVSFGIFQSFQTAREANDIIYSALLPISKADIVKGKFIFSIFIEMCGFAVMVIMTVLRMTIFADSVVYRSNVLMNANLIFLGFVLLIFGCFNAIFICGFFKTAYYYGKPFVFYIIVAFIIISIAETLHHIPGLEAVNAFGFTNMSLQLSGLIAGAVLYVLLTFIAFKKSIKRFEVIDL
ncbi:ABC-2 transporter permease [[Clostridium] cellulosi]